VACDPQKVIDDMFLKQGLHVIRPIRTYIAVAGLVVVPQRSSPYYVDPVVTLPAQSADDAATVDFQSVIASESRGQTFGLKAATDALSTLAAIPVGFSFSADQEVELPQIHASGVRLKLNVAKDMLSDPKMQKEVLDDLTQGRTFLVYEVYKASQISFSAKGGLALTISLAPGKTAGGAKPSTPTTGSNAQDTKLQDTKPADAKPPAGAKPGDPPASQSKPSKPAADGANAADVACKDPTPDSTGLTPPAADAPLSLVWARKSTTELAICGEKSYPFAVRLAEIVKTPAGGLQLRPGSFKFSGGLGAPTDEEKYTAFVSKTPVLPDLKRQVRR
jgi:hypothetical protein